MISCISNVLKDEAGFIVVALHILANSYVFPLLMANRSVQEPDPMYESARWVKGSPGKASKGKTDLGCIKHVLKVNVTVVMQPIYLVVNKHGLEQTRPFTASASLASNLTFYLYLLGP